jgi:hypothetical protein
MEGSMDKNGNKLSNKTALPNKPKLEITVDTSGMWFAAVALFAVLAAGIIIYHAANDDILTASNDTLPAPASSSR